VSIRSGPPQTLTTRQAGPNSLITWRHAPHGADGVGVGVFKGVLTRRPLLRSGIEFALVALGSAVVGWLIGQLFEDVSL